MKKLLFALVFVAALVGAGTAQATAVIDFTDGGTSGGLVTYAGGVITGVGIPIDLLKVKFAPLNNGNAIDVSGLNGYGLLGFTFGPNGGSIEIKGGVPAASIVDGSVLLTGTFTSGSVTKPSANLLSFNGTGIDTKDATLLTWIGLDPKTPFEFFGFSIAVRPNADGSYEAISTDITNTAVPEPGSMMLLGTGLFGLAGAVRRRMKK